MRMRRPTSRPRHAISRAVPVPSGALLDGWLLLQTAALTTSLVLAIGLSSAIFNETLKANREEVNGWCSGVCSDCAGR